MGDVIYIVSSVPGETGRIAHALGGDSHDVRSFDCAEQLITVLDKEACGCVIAPVDLPGMGIHQLIAALRRLQLALAIVVIGREDDLAVAVNVIRAGASEYVEPPASASRVRSAVRRALAAARVARVHK